MTASLRFSVARESRNRSSDAVLEARPLVGLWVVTLWALAGKIEGAQDQLTSDELY
jgi:hypothetical protein